MQLQANELVDIRGGAKSGPVAIFILIFGGFMTVMAGLFDGLSNPNKCNN